VTGASQGADEGRADQSRRSRDADLHLPYVTDIGRRPDIGDDAGTDPDGGFHVLQDLKKFLMRGNVIDLAVAVVIGAAFGLVVSSFVDNIINPIIAAIFGEPDISEVAAITLRENEEGDAVLRIGAFLQQVLDFLIIGTALFFVVQAFTRLQELRARGQAADADTPTPSDEALLLGEIRDLLRSQAR